MNKLEEILEYYPDEEFMTADGFNDAILGVDESTMKLIYSTTKCIDVLVKENNIDYIDAVEFFQFNVKGGYMGEKTPIWCDDL